MRKVILFMHTSLDGFTAGLNREMNWITVDEEIFNDVLDLQRTADTAFFGGILYREMASYWPSVAANPASAPGEVEHAHWLDQSPKIVFSRTMQGTEWVNSQVVRENIPDEVRRLKAQPGKNILLFGGAEIARMFIKLGLIDEYRLYVNPVILGNGKSLFREVGSPVKLRLLEFRTFSSGVTRLHYQTILQS